MLYFIKWQNFIVWLSLLLELLGNMCIVTLSFPVDNLIKLTCLSCQAVFLLDQRGQDAKSKS